MNKAQLTAIREIAEKNCMYNTETNTLTIKQGSMKRKYINISYEAAIEIVKYMQTRKCAGIYVSVNENDKYVELFYYEPFTNGDHFYDANDNPYKVVGNWPNAKAKKIHVSY